MLTLNGFYDLHIHSAPAPFVRIGDSADIARWCAEAGMAGIVIKSHFESTVSKAYHARLAVRDAFPEFQVFSGIALNRGVGGVNPGAVELALQQGAKIVWLPTLDAANISFNLVKVVADGLAVGPILIGVAQPAHIVTPSVTVRGIVNMTAVAVVEAQGRRDGWMDARSEAPSQQGARR